MESERHLLQVTVVAFGPENGSIAFAWQHFHEYLFIGERHRLVMGRAVQTFRHILGS
jgi:hypothetical protein